MDLPPYPREEFPPEFSSRRQDMCEPLLHLADTLGGQWPKRARRALYLVFQQEADFDFQPALQLLQDIQHCFFFHSNPDRLSTVTLVDWMHNLPARPWDVDGPITPRAFVRLLLALDIRPRLQRLGKEGPARGYQIHDFEEAWKKHLGVLPIARYQPAWDPNVRFSSLQNTDTVTPPTMNCEAPAPPTGSPAAINQTLAAVQSQIKNQNSEIVNSEIPTVPFGMPDDRLAELEARSQQLAALQSKIKNQNSEIPNNDALRNGIIEYFANRIAALQNRKGEANELR